MRTRKQDTAEARGLVGRVLALPHGEADAADVKSCSEDDAGDKNGSLGACPSISSATLPGIRDSLAGHDHLGYDRIVLLLPSNYGPKSRFLSSSSGPDGGPGAVSRQPNQLRQGAGARRLYLSLSRFVQKKELAARLRAPIVESTLDQVLQQQR